MLPDSNPSPEILIAAALRYLARGYSVLPLIGGDPDNTTSRTFCAVEWGRIQLRVHVGLIERQPFESVNRRQRPAFEHGLYKKVPVLCFALVGPGRERVKPEGDGRCQLGFLRISVS